MLQVLDEVLAHLAGVLVGRVRLFRQQHTVSRSRSMSSWPPKPTGNFANDPHGLEDGLTIETVRHLTGQDQVEHHAARTHHTDHRCPAWPRRPARAPVLHRPDKSPGLGVHRLLVDLDLGCAGDAVVDDLRFTLLVHQNVAGFRIPVDDLRWWP